MGRLRAGDRLPSVRQLAQRNDINLKTAFVIYQRLQAEGYVNIKPGAGAFVSEVEQSDLEQAYCLSLFRLIKTHISEAARLKIGPGEYVALVEGFVGKRRQVSVRLAVVECNEEQVGLFAHEISGRLGMTVHPVLLDRLETPDRRTSGVLSRVDYIATTHFHYKQVRSLTAKYQKRLLQLRLNPSFVPSIVDAARQGTVLMIVSNADYFPAFRQSLLQIGTPHALVERITAVSDRDLALVRSLARRTRTVYVSPICDSRVRELFPPRIRELSFDTTLSAETLEALEAIKLFRPIRP
jgi:DNA-binding transcriptional regulator YhcF (GntR family)